MQRITREQFDEHDCKNTEDEGCQVCLAYGLQVQEENEKRVDQYIEDEAFNSDKE